MLYIALDVVINTTARSKIRTWVLSHRIRTIYPLDHCDLPTIRTDSGRYADELISYTA